MATLVKFLFFCCVPFLVSNKNINEPKDFSLLGHWKVNLVELVDDEGTFKRFCVENNLNFDDFQEGIKLFEEVEYIFQENGILEIINPDKLGGNGETNYEYANGSDVLIFGGRKYGFRIKSPNEILIIDYALGHHTQLIMNCIRIN
jgi:hypothetical protein